MNGNHEYEWVNLGRIILIKREEAKREEKPKWTLHGWPGKAIEIKIDQAKVRNNWKKYYLYVIVCIIYIFKETEQNYIVKVSTNLCD